MKKTLRRLFYVFSWLVLAGLTAFAALWFWSGLDGSLATALNQAGHLLPSGQTLEVRDVKGSLRHGGSIGWLRWQQGELSVEASEVATVWSTADLTKGELRLARLAIAHLRITDRSAAAAPTAPSDLRLPLRIDAHFSVATLEWVGPPALQAKQITGHYRFDGQQHALDQAKVQIASGSYEFSGRVLALAPMSLSVKLQGDVQMSIPSSRQTLTAKAQAELRGQLAGRDAALELKAQLATEGKTAAGAVAQIRPWQAQPIVGADVHWQSLNLAALWPQAPQTELDGKASVLPDGTDWRARIEFRNAQAGPWNQQRLPLDSLHSELLFSQGQWTLKSLQAAGAGGHIQAQGNLARRESQSKGSLNWQGTATLHAVKAAAIDSRLAATVLDGELKAEQVPSGIAFDVQLQAAPRQSTARQGASRGSAVVEGLRLKSVAARGLWSAPDLRFDTLQVQTDDGELQGQLSLNTGSLAMQGRVALTLPGAQARIEGEIAAERGGGEIGVDVNDATLLAHWLERWPGSPVALHGAAIQGGAEFTGRWHGGWQRQARELQIDASLQAAQLDLRAAGQGIEQAWHVRELQTALSGTLAAWTIKVQGQADHASRHFALATQAHGGQRGDGLWQLQLEKADLSARDNQNPGSWTLQLGEGLALNWRRSGSASMLEIAPGSARLSAPLPGSALLSWQRGQWSQQDGRSQWRTEGSLQGLPLSWLDQLSGNPINRVGLGGDLLFGGKWQASSAEVLQLHASLERSSGDLLLLPDDAKADALRAGLKQAQLLVTANGERLAASLRWDSQNAGQVQADFSTLLQRHGDSWSWPIDAPLTGTLRAALPPIADWSRLAPPGWRLRGTVEGSAELSGTRGAPQWHGTLQARDLALSSVADGINFSKGSLHAMIEGQRLEIVDFTIGGAGASDAGVLTAKGSVDWLPAATPAANLSSRLRMALDVQADALNVSTAADRRLVLSGQLSASLVDALLTLRGALKADQALFVLPEDTSPTIGDDVIVRSKGTPLTRVAPPSAPSPSARVGVTPDILVSLDLGERFRVRGHGLNTRLGGKLDLRSGVEHARVPRLSGELHTVGGVYKAYGQNLNIEDGVLRFDGPYDNPVLDILAIRPNLQQRVGVRISGMALSPVVRLYADPDLPEAEKLSWLVLGRSAANGGSEAAVLQQAALSLLGSKGAGASGGVARSLGLDELSIGSSATSANSNVIGGSATDTTVKLGKHVAQNFYVAYERGLTSAMGTFYIFYELSRQFTVRAQTGEKSAVDLIFTLRYD